MGKTQSMDKVTNLIMLLLFSLSLGQETQDMEDIEEMFRNMNLRFHKAEKKWSHAEDQLAEALTELAFTKHDLAAAVDNLAKVQNDLATTKRDLAASKIKQMAKDKELENEIARMKNPPHMHACGSHYNGQTIVSGTIPYTTLLYSSTNTEGGGLDIESGVFTSTWPGSYTVTWSLHCGNDAQDPTVNIYLQKNGNNIKESKLDSYFTGDGHVGDMGGRTLVLHLNRGDTLQLYCDDCSAGVYFTTFCVSLTTFDV